MKSGINYIIGKTISDVVIAENSRHPKQHVFLVFTDGTHLELYGDSIQSANELDRGDKSVAMNYAKKMGATIIHVCPGGEGPGGIIDARTAKNIAARHLAENSGLELVESIKSPGTYGFDPEKEYLFIYGTHNQLDGDNYITVSKETGKVICMGCYWE